VQVGPSFLKFMLRIEPRHSAKDAWFHFTDVGPYHCTRKRSLFVLLLGFPLYGVTFRSLQQTISVIVFGAPSTYQSQSGRIYGVEGQTLETPDWTHELQ
jgi:hypothetical protein